MVKCFGWFDKTCSACTQECYISGLCQDFKLCQDLIDSGREVGTFYTLMILEHQDSELICYNNLSRDSLISLWSNLGTKERHEVSIYRFNKDGGKEVVHNNEILTGEFDDINKIKDAADRKRN